MRASILSTPPLPPPAGRLIRPAEVQSQAPPQLPLFPPRWLASLSPTAWQQKESRAAGQSPEAARNTSQASLNLHLCICLAVIVRIHIHIHIFFLPQKYTYVLNKYTWNEKKKNKWWHLVSKSPSLPLTKYFLFILSKYFRGRPTVSSTNQSRVWFVESHFRNNKRTKQQQKSWI